MTAGSHSVLPGIVGRADQLRVLGEAIDRAADGEPSAVFVHGETGVGKTRLAQVAAERARARGFEVLWGRCLRFGAVESVLLSWVVALEGWLAESEPEVRHQVLDSVPGAARLLPSLGGGPQDDSTQLLAVAEALLARVVTLRPTVLVMDDVQWADAASRDALSYLVAGFGRQHELVVATYRDEGLPVGDPLFGWLADMRRMPHVADLSLQRLTQAETAEQLTGLLGRPAASSLVEAVQHRSDGNPYLSELLAQGLEPGAEELPPGLPADLSAALLAAWHRLGDTAREVLRVVAVSGRPVLADLLVATCCDLDLDEQAVRRGLAEAAAAGTLVPAGDDQLWLRHPLLAEVLYETYLPGEAAPVHRAWAARLADTGTPSVADQLRRLGDLALHHERGGDVDAAFAASLAAADEARARRLWRDEPVHLQRAARLWPRLSRECRERSDEVTLLERAAVASSRVGQQAEALALGRQALALARRAGDPRRTSRLLVWCEETAWWLGEVADEPLSGLREAVEIVRALPGSREYAEALASLADALAWTGRWTDAGATADEALAAARRSGSLEALAIALGARSFARLSEDTSETDSVQSLELAVQTGDPDRIQWSAQSRINRLLATGRLHEATELGEWALATALDSGALSAAMWHAGAVAHYLADEGRLTEAAQAVRTGVSLTGVGNGAASIRLAAVITAVRSGDVAAAALHLRRAEEQIPRVAERPGLEAPPVLAELMLAEGRPQNALDLVLTTMGTHSVDTRVTDLMTLWGVRAAAAMATHSQDRGDRKGIRRARNLLYRLGQTRDRLPGSPFEGSVPGDPVLAAWRALRDAEIAGFPPAPPAPDAWAAAVRTCEAAGLGWEMQVANLRWGAALLAAGSARADVALPLRAAHRYAVAEQADRLRRDVEALAASARVSLAEPDVVVPAQRGSERGPFDALTPREQEVLTHLVAGRTYAEIARALYISDKTVSAHVSNLLRKTGTASRHEVSALMLRLQGAGTPR